MIYANFLQYFTIATVVIIFRYFCFKMNVCQFTWNYVSSVPYVYNTTCAAPQNTCATASTFDLACNGSGIIFEIPDACMDDGGIHSAGDSMEVYCVCNLARFCLSGESCPWRNMNDSTPDIGLTCSRAGLTSSYMANAWCNLWNNHTNYNCCYDGFIGFWFDIISKKFVSTDLEIKQFSFVTHLRKFCDSEGSRSITFSNFNVLIQWQNFYHPPKLIV